MLNNSPSTGYKNFINKNIFVFFVCIQCFLILLLSLGYYKEMIIVIVIFFNLVGIIFPLVNILLLSIISLGIEGKLIENFVLFRYLGFNWYLMDLCFFLTFLILIIQFYKYVNNLKLDLIGYLIIFFLFIAFMSLINGIRNGNDSQSAFYDFRGFFYYLTFIPTILILDSKKKIIYLFYFILTIITIKSIIDIYFSLFVFEKTFNLETREMLGFARLTGYNEIVYLISLVGAFFTIFLIKSNEKKFFLFFIILFSLIALFLSYTRGSWVAAITSIIIGFIILLIMGKQFLNIKNFFITGIIMLFVLFVLDLLQLINFSFIFERAKSISVNQIDISGLGRLVEYATALEAFFSNPLMGVGLGFHFVYFSPGIGTVDSVYCHNSYLYVLSKMGIIGLFLFLLLIFFTLKDIFPITRKLAFDEFYIISFSFILIFLSIVVKSFTTWHLNTNTFSLFVGILFGLVIKIKYFLKVDNDRRKEIYN